MINDLLYLLNSHSKLHIDDTFLNTNIYFQLIKTTTKNTLYRAVVWFRPNVFKLSVKKTQRMIFSFGYMYLDISVSSVKCLSIFVNNMWSWESHVDYISGKIYRVIRSQKKFNVPFNCVRSFYFGFFQIVKL